VDSTRPLSDVYRIICPEERKQIDIVLFQWSSFRINKYADVWAVIRFSFHSSNKNLVLQARSEILSYAEGCSRLNPKHEIRNPKQYLMIQIKMIKTRPWRYTFKHYV
jgi:hypothetical protein